MPRDLQTHEALIIAVSEISRQPDVPEMGVTSERLAQHSLTKDISERDLDWAIERARVDGWLMDDDLLDRSLDNKWHGIRPSNAGLEKVTELTRPWWRTVIAALSGDVRTILIAAITAVVISLILRLV